MAWTCLIHQTWLTRDGASSSPSSASDSQLSSCFWPVCSTSARPRRPKELVKPAKSRGTRRTTRPVDSTSIDGPIKTSPSQNAMTKQQQRLQQGRAAEYRFQPHPTAWLARSTQCRFLHLEHSTRLQLLGIEWVHDGRVQPCDNSAAEVGPVSTRRHDIRMATYGPSSYSVAANRGGTGQGRLRLVSLSC